MLDSVCNFFAYLLVVVSLKICLMFSGFDLVDAKFR